MKIKQGSTWRDVPIGGYILEPGTAAEYKTGSWRSMRPIWHADKCTNCMNCWLYCPDMSIKLNDEGKVTGIDYEYCKGCGLCAKVCPKKASAIDMIQGGATQEGPAQEGGE